CSCGYPIAETRFCGGCGTELFKVPECSSCGSYLKKQDMSKDTSKGCSKCQAKQVLPQPQQPIWGQPQQQPAGMDFDDDIPF
ncbi:serine/threonine protein kinase, partial [Vibrio parahaemolyticus]|nr:serine/threonine protein kinase [Vibrio parahaemolyticus]